MKKTILLWISLLLVVGAVFAIQGTVSSFYGQGNPIKTNYTAYQNKTYYIDFPITYIKNASVKINTSIYNKSQIVYYGFNNNLNDISSYNKRLINSGATILFNNSNPPMGDYYAYFGGNRVAYNLSALNFRNYEIDYTKINISFYIKLINNSNIGNESWLLSFGQNGITFKARFKNNTGGVIRVEPDGTSTMKPFSSLNHTLVGKWLHVRFSASSNGIDTQYKIYINNVLENSKTSGAGIISKLDKLYIAAAYNGVKYGGQFFMDDLSIYNASNFNINKSLYITDKKVGYSTSDAFTTSLNISYLNNLLSTWCVCSGCVKSGTNCRIPINILAYSSTLDITLTNASYAYGIDNCTNSFGIPSNATALNITYKDIGGNPSIVNSTVTVSGAYNYTNTRHFVTNDQVCIYPSWYNISNSVEVRYQRGDAFNYYNFDMFMDSTTYALLLYTQPQASSTVTFTTYIGSQPLPEVMGTMYRKINGNYVTIESKTSDITGRLQFNYETNTDYKFFFAKSNYQNYIFYLNPILFTEYDVPMTRTIQLNTTIDYEKVAIHYSPKIFHEYKSTNFTFMIQCPTAELQAYDYTITYPTGSVSNSGTDAIGSQLKSNFTIGNADINDILTIHYCYTIENYPQRCFTDSYPITLGNETTLIGIRDKTYGLGLFERAITATIIGIVVTGLAALVGQVIVGIMLTFMVWGILVYIGFIPIWLVLIPIFIGLFLLALRGGQ